MKNDSDADGTCSECNEAEGKICSMLKLSKTNTLNGFGHVYNPQTTYCPIILNIP